MKAIQYAIKKLDFFGRQINFTINREEHFTTVCGGFISIIILCLYTAFFFFFGQEMFYKLNPHITTENLIPENQESYTITNETFIAWRISSADDSSLFFHDKFKSLLLYNINNSTYKKSKSAYSKELQSINCTNQKFKHNFEDSVYEADKWMCFDFSAIENQNLTGSQSSPFYSYLSFTLELCEVNYFNSTKSKCTDYHKLSKFLINNNLIIEFLFYDTGFRPKNFLEPFERKINYYRNFLNINLLKRDNFFFEKSIVKQDASFFWRDEVEVSNMFAISESTTENYVKFVTDDYLDDYYANDKYQNRYSVYLCKFFYVQEYKHYTRRYQKVQDVMGKVNGCLQLLTFVFGGVYYFYCKYRFEDFIFNKLVNVKIDKGLFLHKKENEMKIINCNYRKESDLSKEKFDVMTKINKDNKNEVGEKNHVDYERSKITINSRQIYSDSIQDKNKDSISRRLFNFPISDGVNEARSENCIEKNSLSEEDKKIFIEKLEKLSSDSKNKRSFLQKNLCIKFCKRKEKKYSFDIKLQETYVDKINEKFDITYYLRWLRQFKILKKFIFKEENEPQIFKILASDAYNVSIKDYNDDFFKEDKNLKGIIEQWVKSLNNVNQTNLSKYLVNNFQMQIQN